MRAPTLLLCLALAACRQGPPVPTEAENRDLNEAEQMLNEAPERLGPVDEEPVENAPSAG